MPHAMAARGRWRARPWPSGVGGGASGAGPGTLGTPGPWVRGALERPQAPTPLATPQAPLGHEHMLCVESSHLLVCSGQA